MNVIRIFTALVFSVFFITMGCFSYLDPDTPMVETRNITDPEEVVDYSEEDADTQEEEVLYHTSLLEYDQLIERCHLGIKNNDPGLVWYCFSNLSKSFPSYSRDFLPVWKKFYRKISQSCISQNVLFSLRISGSGSSFSDGIPCDEFVRLTFSVPLLGEYSFKLLTVRCEIPKLVGSGTEDAICFCLSSENVKNFLAWLE